jgi:hypothetical protein
MEKDRWVALERERSPVLGKELEMNSQKKYRMIMRAESTEGLLFGKIDNSKLNKRRNKCSKK